MNHAKKIEPKIKTFKQGYFIPEHPEKYKGDITKIFYRSSWEQIFMTKYCDRNPNCLLWSSEEISIPYYNPIDKKIHQYYIDFFCILKEAEDKNIGVLIEIKPFKELQPPDLSNVKRLNLKKVKRYNQELIEYIKNQSKWLAAKEFAKQHNMKFMIITEKDLFGDSKN